MLDNETVTANLKNCLTETAALGLPNGRVGKVRDAYDLGGELLLITTDRQSAFDRVLAAIPFKGAVLNLVSEFWFERTAAIVPNHVLDVPDPNVTVARKCKVYPIEFVMRGYLTGSTSTSAWVNYEKGVRQFCGNTLPEGMRKNQAFAAPILTPTTKSDEHDEQISAEQIIERGIISEDRWRKLSATAFALFADGQKVAAEHGLILVDTKYEFGYTEDEDVVLIDEIHTPDSSRYWKRDSYEERFQAHEEPENIDKEFLRLWFKENCDPYHDEVLPAAPDHLVIELSRRYQLLYEMITGREFTVDTAQPVLERLRSNLRQYL